MAEGNRLPSLENAPHLKTDGEFFRIPPSPFSQRESFSKTYPSFLTVKEGSTFLTKPLFNGLYTPFGSPVPGGQKPQKREDVTALRCSEPLRYKVGGPSKVFAMVVRDGTALIIVKHKACLLYTSDAADD